MDVARFYRTIRHVPKQQLLRRFWLTARRRLTMSPLGGFLRVRRLTPVPAVAHALPQPIFPRRVHLVVEREGNPCLHQLNRTYALTGKIDWDLEHEEQSTHLERLAFHYLEFLESIDVGLGEAIVLDWIDQTPPWQPGYWLDTWNSYAVSIRTVCMMQWLARNRGALSDSTFATVAASVAEQIRFLAKNLELDIRGNHLMKNIKALLWAGRFFEGKEADSWHRLGERLLNHELKAQFLEDGMHFELSPAYHCQVFADVLECASVIEEARRSEIVRRLEPSAQAIADLAHPDERISLFNDAGLNMAYRPHECLDGFESLGGKRPDPQPRFEFGSSGFYGARFERGYVLFDAGPSCCDSLPAHGHGDILAFEWTIGSQRVIVDAGVREYEIGPQREWNRSTRAHNTVTVGDRDQCEFIRNFRVGHRAHGRCELVEFLEDSIRVKGCYTAANADGQTVEHVRSFRARNEEIHVFDELSSTIAEPAVARLLLHHDCEVDERDGIEIRIGEHRIQLTSTSPMNVVESKWSPDFGTEFPTKQIEIHYGTTPCTGEFTLRIETE